MSQSSLKPVLVLSLATCLTQFDVTAAAIALPAIRQDLAFGLQGAAWVMDAYSLAFAGFLLAAGALADRHGRRRLLLLGNLGFALASLGCGLAWDGASLWAARALQGMAAAFMVTGALASISVAYPEAGPRARAFAIAGMCSGAAMALGPSLGGLIAETLGWRWIFLVNLPVCVLGIWPVCRLVRESCDEHGRALDWGGILLLTAALALPVQALLRSDGVLLWRGLEAMAGLLLLAGFVLQQRRRQQPMLDAALVCGRQPAGIAILLLALSLGYWAALVFLPLYLETAFRLAPAFTGTAMLAATLPMLLLPHLGGRLLPRLGPARGFGGGLGILAFGLAALAFATTLPQALAAMVLAAGGAGLINAQASGALAVLVPPAQAGMASALTVVLRQGGFAIGIALIGAIAGHGGLGFTAAFAMAAGFAAGGALLVAILLRG